MIIFPDTLCITRFFHFCCWEHDLFQPCMSSGHCSTCLFSLDLSVASSSFFTFMHWLAMSWRLEWNLKESGVFSLSLSLLPPILILSPPTHSPLSFLIFLSSSRSGSLPANASYFGLPESSSFLIAGPCVDFPFPRNSLISWDRLGPKISIWDQVSRASK